MQQFYFHASGSKLKASEYEIVTKALVDEKYFYVGRHLYDRQDYSPTCYAQT